KSAAAIIEAFEDGRNRIHALNARYSRRPILGAAGDLGHSSLFQRHSRRAAMTTVLMECIQNYVAKYGYAAPQKKSRRMKRAALYSRVSTYDQNPQTQILDLRQMAAQRGYAIVKEYTDKISGVKAKRPGLDAMMADARRGQFDVV